MRHKLLLHLLLFLISASLCGQEVEFEILKPYDRVYYNSNIPSVEVMAYAGRYFNSHGELECIIKDGDKIIYRFSQNFMAAMNDSAKLSFAFNLDPGFYKVELRKEGKLINECVIGYEPEFIEKKGVVEEPGSGFENYWRGKIEELSTYPKLTEVGAYRKGSQYLAWGNKSIDKTPHEGFYTQKELKEIVAYAARLNIMIVPELDMPAHLGAAIAAYPELSCRDVHIDVPVIHGGTPENNGIGDVIGCAGKEFTYRFIYEITCICFCSIYNNSPFKIFTC